MEERTLIWAMKYQNNGSQILEVSSPKNGGKEKKMVGMVDGPKASSSPSRSRVKMLDSAQASSLPITIERLPGFFESTDFKHFLVRTTNGVRLFERHAFCSIRVSLRTPRHWFLSYSCVWFTRDLHKLCYWVWRSPLLLSIVTYM